MLGRGRNTAPATMLAGAAGVSLAEIVVGLQSVGSMPGLLIQIDAGQPFLMIIMIIDEAKFAMALVIALEEARRLTAGGPLSSAPQIWPGQAR